MKITNTYGLPGPIVSAVSAGVRKPVRGVYSVTDLIGPPLIRALKIQHWDALEDDASDRLWALLGTATHAILERADTRNHFAEEPLAADLDGATILGHPDLLDNDGVLSDYKVTSVFAFLLDEKAEWEAQLNAYAWLYRSQGFRIKQLRIVAILRDWNRRRAQTDPTYPPVPLVNKVVPTWIDVLAEQYLRTRLDLHRRMEQGEMIACTDADRWHRPDTWAVKKPGRKRALRVYGEQAAAETHAATEETLLIEHRPGADLRCASYCVVRAVCPYRTATEIAETEEVA